MNHNRFLGFTKDENGHLIVEPKEAEVVKRIFREYLEGASLQQIGRGLEADGILTGAGKQKWRPETLHKILQNEKYIGDALLQKNYTVDLKELLKVANSRGNYDAIADEIYRLRETKHNALSDNAEREGLKKRISEMQQFLAEQQQDITEYDEQLVRRLIEKITIYEEKATVEFKSGTSVDVRR